MQTSTSLETKAHDDWRLIVDELKSAFEHYKDANDRTLAEIRARGSADALDVDKLARIDRTLDELKGRLDAQAVRAARP